MIFFVNVVHAISLEFANPTPENGTIQNTNSILMNVTTTELNEYSIIPNFDSSLVSWWRMDDRNDTAIFDYLGKKPVSTKQVEVVIIRPQTKPDRIEQCNTGH